MAATTKSPITSAIAPMEEVCACGVPNGTGCQGAHIPHEMPEVTELRISVPETGRRLLPLPVAPWHVTVGRVAVAGLRQDSIANRVHPDSPL